MPLDLGTTSATFHLGGTPIFVNGFRRLWGLGCCLTWREPGCDSFATALFGRLVLARIVQLKLRHEALADGVSVDPAKERCHLASVQSSAAIPLPVC